MVVVGWSLEILAFGLTNNPLNGCGHSHLTSFNYANN